MSKHVVDKEAWSRLDIFNQMGNIGSEVGRALSAKQAGKESRMDSAFYRGMDLINMTVDLWSDKNKPVRELLIAREQFAKSILTDDLDTTLEKYFFDFALAARLQR